MVYTWERGGEEVRGLHSGVNVYMMRERDRQREERRDCNNSNNLMVFIIFLVGIRPGSIPP